MAKTKNKKSLKISLPIFITVMASVIVTAILTNNKSPNINPNLNQATSTNDDDEKENKMPKIFVSFGTEKLEMNLEENSTAAALAKLLPLDVTMEDLNSNEKYVYLDDSLPTNHYNPKHINAGDVMLFGDNCLVIFYESFDASYSYSKIGHINNLPELSSGSISIKLSLK